MRNLFLGLIILLCALSWNCKKNDNALDTTLTPLEQKLLGTWNNVYTSVGGAGGYWVYESIVIDSLSSASNIYRKLDVHTGLCGVNGYWHVTADSVIKNSCVPNAKITKVTDDSLVFVYNGSITYIWTR